MKKKGGEWMTIDVVVKPEVYKKTIDKDKLFQRVLKAFLFSKATVEWF